MKSCSIFSHQEVLREELTEVKKDYGDYFRGGYAILLLPD